MNAFKHSHHRMFVLAVGAALSTFTATHTVIAQAATKRVAKGASCAPIDTAASWSRRQREWLDERTQKWSDDALRSTLLKSSASEAVSGALLGFEIIDAAPIAATPADAEAIAKLKALMTDRTSTWPTRSVVGARGVLAVWALAGRDTSVARVALRRMMEAGPDESPPSAVAILEDRQRVRRGRKQLYGTQLQRNATGVLEPLPIEDEAHLALRRDGAELPPLAQSLCAARAAIKP